MGDMQGEFTAAKEKAILFGKKLDSSLIWGIYRVNLQQRKEKAILFKS